MRKYFYVCFTLDIYTYTTHYSTHECMSVHICRHTIVYERKKKQSLLTIMLSFIVKFYVTSSEFL